MIEIATPLVRASVCLPDPERGYYRGTRFDWSGVIATLEHGGHRFFGPWFEHHDPMKHDGIVGPAEEFVPPGGGLGYSEAPAGGSFIRIGVGVLRKPDDEAYRRFATYEMVDPGRWTIRRQADGVEFRHEVAAASGYAYEYRKVIRLGRTRPTLWLGHSLRNTGQRTIDTSHYNHNFLVIDERPSGPEFEVRFPFVPLLIEGPSELLAVRGKALVYKQPLLPGSSVLARLGGFEASASDHVITVEGQGAGVEIRGDRPLCDMVFWSTPRTLCPEPYVAIAVAPGREMSWTSEYEFHSR